LDLKHVLLGLQKNKMKKMKTLLTLAAAVGLVTTSLNAQINTDGFFNKKGETNIALSYTEATFDEFYLGETRIDGVPVHNEIDQTVYDIYANYGITDRLTVIANLPFIVAEGNGGADPVNGETKQSDLQDISLILKWAAFVKEENGNKVTGIATIGGSYAFDYEANGILSIGSGAPEIDAKLGLQYNDKSGFFGNAFVGYALKGEADNTFGLGDGGKFDVPNSVNAQIKLGYAAQYFYVDAWFDAQKSNGSLDINDPDFGGRFPETKVDYSRIGLNVYVPIIKNLGLSAAAGRVISGRNVGISTFFTGGLVIGLGKE